MRIHFFIAILLFAAQAFGESGINFRAEDLYGLFGLERNATRQDFVDAQKRAMDQLKFYGAEQPGSEFFEHTKVVSGALAVLRDDNLKQIYDRWLVELENGSYPGSNAHKWNIVLHVELLNSFRSHVGQKKHGPKVLDEMFKTYAGLFLQEKMKLHAPGLVEMESPEELKKSTIDRFKKASTLFELAGMSPHRARMSSQTGNYQAAVKAALQKSYRALSYGEKMPGRYTNHLAVLTDLERLLEDPVMAEAIKKANVPRVFKKAPLASQVKMLRALQTSLQTHHHDAYGSLEPKAIESALVALIKDQPVGNWKVDLSVSDPRQVERLQVDKPKSVAKKQGRGCLGIAILGTTAVATAAATGIYFVPESLTDADSPAGQFHRTYKKRVDGAADEAKDWFQWARDSIYESVPPHH